MKGWCVPPKDSARFAADMENVLDLYTSEHDPEEPLICTDEASKQLLGHAHDPAPCAPGRAAREDFQYERKGTRALFCFFDPFGGWRRVDVTESRTAVDWAEQVRKLLEEDYPRARKVRLVCDNLNTHKVASLYEAFEPAHARALARRLEIHHTPVHASWLNVAEIELSVLAGQCLDRRIPTAEELAGEVSAWARERNESKCSVRWRFTTEQARIKLRHLYPQL